MHVHIIRQNDLVNVQVSNSATSKQSNMQTRQICNPKDYKIQKQTQWSNKR